MENAAVRVPIDRATAPGTDQPTGLAPHQLIVTADSLRVNLSLVAPTEGRARFITNSPAITHEARRGIPGALYRLADQCGFPCTEEMIHGVVVAGPPLALHLVGERGTADQTALDYIARYGIAHVEAPPPPLPRHPERDRAWCDAIRATWEEGEFETLLVVIPPGALPLWVAPLLTTLAEGKPAEYARLLVIGSDPDLAAALPPGALFLPRDERLTEHLAAALNYQRATRLFNWLPGQTPVVSRPEALAAAARAIATERGTPCVYLDVADGTTVVVADERAFALHHDPAMDYARSAVRLLNRAGPDEIARWLPFPLDPAALRAWAVRRVSWPMATLTDDEDRAIAAAMARAALRLALGSIRERISDGAAWILGQSVAALGAPAFALRSVADLLPAVRLATVARDGDDLLPIVGLLASLNADDATGALVADAVIPAGSVLQDSASGERARGTRSVTITCRDDRRTVAVPSNTMTTIPCDAPATITLTRDGRDETPIRVEGGDGGILLDTRRRPLATVPRQESRPNVSERLRPTASREPSHNETTEAGR